MRRNPNTDKPLVMPAAELSLGGTEREVVGVIVTARNQETDERRVIHRSGLVREAIAHIVTERETRGADGSEWPPRPRSVSFEITGDSSSLEDAAGMADVVELQGYSRKTPCA